MKFTSYLAAVLVFAGAAKAAVYNIETSLNPLQAGTDNQGWYGSNNSNNNATNDNYYTGFGGGSELRSWFAFDLSSVAGTITGITFEVTRYGQSGNLTLGIFDVTTPASQLPLNRGAGVFPAIFNDLGSGTSYGTFSVLNGSSTDVLSLALNPAAIFDANAASGYFAIGAAIVGSSSGFIFAGSNNEPGNGGSGYTQRLVITTDAAGVPETSGAAGLLAAALAGLGIARRRSPRP